MDVTQNLFSATSDRASSANLEKTALLCLALAPGVGPKTFQMILSAMEEDDGLTIVHLFDQDKGYLKQLGLAPKSISHLLAHPPKRPDKTVEATLQWQDGKHQHLVFWNDADYPERLKQISSPPPVLMVKGNPNALHLPQIAVVGSRHPTPVGRQQAYEFSHDLSETGFVVTSGLAKGVDSAAHQGALDAQGMTVAVVGNGLNHIYPSQHRALAEQIVEQGALVSEFPLHTKPHPGNFPRRNRIVSGLSLGTLVVEAALKSGSLITARQALEQNREVFAIPGAIQNPQKSGCHYLIRQGATLVEKVEDITAELELGLMARQALSQHKQIPDADFAQTDDEKSLLKALDYDGCSIDELTRRSGLSVVFITTQLIQWEIKGFVRQSDGLFMLK